MVNIPIAGGSTDIHILVGSMVGPIFSYPLLKLIPE
jgi:hypothetical protein